MAQALSPIHPASGERPRTPFLPHHLLGWAAVIWLVATWAFLACWGKLNDILNATTLHAAAAAFVLVAVFLAWGAFKKDRSLLLGVLSLLSGVVAMFGLLVLLAFMGEALS
jgi:hypothetical protein